MTAPVTERRPPPERATVPLGIWLVLLAGLILTTMSATVAVVSAINEENRDETAAENQTISLCVASVDAKVTRQFALSTLEAVDLPKTRERLLRAALDDLDRIIEDLLTVRGERQRDVCAEAVDLRGST